MFSRVLFTTIFAALVTQGALAATPKLVPLRGEKVSFTRTYSSDYLRNGDHTLQRLTKTTFSISNHDGHLIANWKATIRDLNSPTLESQELEAAALCKKLSSTKVECYFSTDHETMVVHAREGQVILEIPYGECVQFSRTDDEAIVHSEILLGASENENIYVVYPKKSR